MNPTKQRRTPWNKGIPWPESVRKRISQSKKGIAAWNKGKSWPSEVREKISKSKKGQIPWNKGRNMSESTKKKISRSKLASTFGLKIPYEKSRGSNRLRFEVFKRDSFRCKYCGRTSEEVPLEVDHIVPRIKGGKSEIDNLVTACRDCNRGKATLDVL